MRDLRGYNGDDVQDHVTRDHVLDNSSWFPAQPYHTCTLPYGYADVACAIARVPPYAAGTRRPVYESPTENQLNRAKTKPPPR